MIVAVNYGRDSLGVEIDLGYLKMVARHLRAESGALFVDVELVFEKTVIEGDMRIIEEAADLSHARLEHSAT